MVHTFNLVSHTCWIDGGRITFGVKSTLRFRRQGKYLPLEHVISTEDGTNNYRSSTRNQPVGDRSLYMQEKSECLDGTLLRMQRVGCGLYPSAGRTRMLNVEYYEGSRYEIDSRHDIVESSYVSYK